MDIVSRKRRLSTAAFAAPAWLAACLVLGGSSSGGALANAILQIASLPILIFIFLRVRKRDLPRGALGLLVLLAVAALLIVVSLVPLPYAIWRNLPGRATIASGYEALGMRAHALPLTLQVEGTIGTLLSLCPPLAMFMLTLRASTSSRLATVVVLGILAITSILFGVAQQVSGYNSPLYIYQITSRGGAVGFFANRNHLATLCLATMPFVAALAVPSRDEVAKAGRPLLTAAILLFLVLGVLIVQSLAGWLLLLPTLAGCWLTYRRRSKVRHGAALAGGAGLALLLVASMLAPAVPAGFGQFAGEVTQRDRRAIMVTTWQAARSALPVGTGFGSFKQFYSLSEDHAQTDSRYVNHAHNDYLELLLEAGLPGALLLVGLLWWFVLNSREAWRQHDGAARTMRAACVALSVIMAHSFVDYPIRTTAIAAVAAFAAGLLTLGEPLRPVRRRYGLAGGAQADDRTISLSPRTSASAAVQLSASRT